MIQSSPTVNWSAVGELFDAADQSLFKTVLSDCYHILHRLLSENRTVQPQISLS